MTAPAINPALNALPGLTGGTGQPAMGGALAGFEALLAALFGEADIAGVPIAQTPAAPANALFAPIEESALDDAALDDAVPDAAEGVEAQANPETVLNPLLMAQATPPPAPTTATSAEATGPGGAAAPAWGRDKTDGAPAAPAIANADPHAGLADKAADGAAQPEIAAVAPAPPTATAAATPATKADKPAAPQPAAGSVPPPAATDAEMAADVTAKAAAPPAEPDTPAPEVLAVETSQASQAAEITRAADAPPPPPAAPKRKDRSAEAVRSEPGAEPVAPKAEGAAGRTPVAAAPAPGDGKTDAIAKAPGFKPAEADAQSSDAAGIADAATGAAETRSTHASGGQAPAGAHPVRGAPETVANLAAQIVKKLDGRSTRFDVELDPIGLGKVDVRVEIGAHGRMTAAMTFETPQAAAELKSRAGELQRALEQAGFDLSGGGMSFDVAGGGGGHGRQEWTQDQGGAFRGRAFQQALETAGEADLAAASGELRLRRGVTGGVDVRI